MNGPKGDLVGFMRTCGQGDPQKPEQETQAAGNRRLTALGSIIRNKAKDSRSPSHCLEAKVMKCSQPAIDLEGSLEHQNEEQARSIRQYELSFLAGRGL